MAVPPEIEVVFVTPLGSEGRPTKCDLIEKLIPRLG
jgi:hypothetical protein